MPHAGICRPTLLLAILILFTPGREARLAGQASGSATDLSGTWSLDIHLSDSPEQVARMLRVDTGEFPLEVFGRGAEASGAGGIGREGTGRGGAGRQGPGRAAASDQMNADDRKTLSELTRPVRFAAPRLTISQTATEVIIEPSIGAPQTLRTDGKAEKHQLEAGTVQRRASWEGPQFLVTYEVGGAGKLTCAYSLVPTTGQLLIRVNFERRPKEPGPFEIKLVYGRAPAAGTAG